MENYKSLKENFKQLQFVILNGEGRIDNPLEKQ